MRKFIFLSILMMAQLTIAATSNKEFYIRGHVIDAKTNEHIPYATITIEGTTIGTISDESGHFFLNGLDQGDYTLRVSMVGYTAVDKAITVNGKEMLDITFKLKEDVMSLDQVVVSASRTEITRRESPTIVTVLPATLFAEVGAPTLVEGLSYQPGVRVEDNCQNCGFTQVRINGLDGHYSQILIDSRPMFSALTGVYGLEQIPANMIERVEVIRGGGSALYGSSAVGGVINVITKVPEYNSAEFANTLNVLGGGALDNNTTANASFTSDNQRAGATIFAQVRTRDGYDANDDGFTEIAEMKSSTIGMRSYLKTGDYSKLSLSYDHSSEYRRGGDNLDLVAHDPNVDIAEMIDHNINGGSINFDLLSRNYQRKLNIYSSLQSTIRDSYYGGGGADAYGLTTELTSVSGAQFTQSWDKLLFMPTEFVAGAEYYYNDLHDGLISDPEDQRDQNINTTSLYLQNEWRNEKLGFLVGVRADKHSLLDDPIFSPRVTLRYNPSESVNLRACYTTGYRAPQIFDEDLHIGIVGGEATSIVLSDDLTQERSQSINVSADLYKDMGNWSTNLLVEGFYTKIKDAFALDDTEDVWVRYNSSGVTVKGVSVEARATLPRVMSLQGSITYQKSEYDEAEEFAAGEYTEVFRSPDLYGYLTANFDVTNKFKISASGTYTGSMLVQHAEGYIEEDTAINTPDFFDANLILSYTFPVVMAGRLELSAGVLNVFNSYQTDFDKGADRDAGYVYGPMAPRRFTCGAKLMF
ncbi:MAG: TonB-dependent receptor [Rikenellaceae bacterium]